MTAKNRPGRPRLPRSDECVMCHPYIEALPFEERQKIAAHRLEHQRLDRRRETWIRYSKGNRRQRASSTTSAAPDPQPAAAASSTGSRRAA